MERFRDLGERGLHSGLSSLGDFEKFILRGNVVDLAVGIVIGAAFNNVVQEFVKDLNPLLSEWKTFTEKIGERVGSGGVDASMLGLAKDI